MMASLLALGANVAGTWGPPAATLMRALQHLNRQGVRVCRAAPLYRTQPVGDRRQPDFFNTAVLAMTRLPPIELMLLCKRLERAAGRRAGRRNGPRPLDIDIIAYGGEVRGWPPGPGRLGHLILPHPAAHARAFVLRPLLDVAPRWVHPVLRMPARPLLRRVSSQEVERVSPFGDAGAPRRRFAAAGQLR